MDETLPYIELDPNQSDVPVGYTRYIVRDWRGVHLGTVEQINVTPEGEPELVSFGPEPSADGSIHDGPYESSRQASYPGEISKIYLVPDGVIDPKIFNLRAGPLPQAAQLLKKTPNKILPDIKGLPADLRTLYETATSQYRSGAYDDAVKAIELLISTVAVENGASPSLPFSCYIQYIAENSVGPPVRSFRMLTKGSLELASRGLSPTMARFECGGLLSYAVTLLQYRYEMDGHSEIRWSME